jgi:DNA polymerase (family X)
MLEKTPPGILEMMNIKGLGPKKLHTIYHELGIESIGELLYACNENRLLLYKGFGAKTQENIKQSIEFYISNQGSYLYQQIEEYANAFTQKLNNHFTGNLFLITGSFNRHNEVIHKLEWVTDAEINTIETFFLQQEYKVEKNENILLAKGPENVSLQFYCVAKGALHTTFFKNNCSPEFFEAWLEKFGWDENSQYDNELRIFEKNKVEFIPPYLRESPAIIQQASTNTLPTVIVEADIRAIIHSHSDWSDGSNTIMEMAKAAIEKGFEYLVISDHSKSAFYANGLFPDRIKVQHDLINELNSKLAPFKIFKSIESDILNDGQLDYPDDVLSTFDLVIASVHSNLKMPEEKAMSRLLAAIKNPYTNILGHMTGRLLLSRNGYPVNHSEIIDACATHNVAIELNAHSRRLDMDWRYIPEAVEKGVLISIDPDAHSVEGFADIKYGVLSAQKAGLTKQNNLSSFSLAEFELWLKKQNAKR